MGPYRDADGDELVIGPQGPGAVHLVTPSYGVAVEVPELAAVFWRMCDAAGLTPAQTRAVAASLAALAGGEACRG